MIADDLGLRLTFTSGLDVTSGTSTSVSLLSSIVIRTSSWTIGVPAVMLDRAASPAVQTSAIIPVYRK